MSKLEKDMFDIINRNHDCKAMATRLNAISARRRRRRSLWRPLRSAGQGK